MAARATALRGAPALAGHARGLAFRRGAAGPYAAPLAATALAPSPRRAARPFSTRPAADALLRLYTDGGCLGNRNVHLSAQPAGWGVLSRRRRKKAEAAEAAGVRRCEQFFNERRCEDLHRGVVVVTQSNRSIAELRGPVLIDATAAHFRGAEVCSNNTAELTAIAEALIWLEREASHGAAVIHYDSKYAALITQGVYKAAKNVALARTCRRLLSAEVKRRSGGVTFVHVKGHSGDVFNDRADELAGQAMDGRRVLQSLAAPAARGANAAIAGPTEPADGPTAATAAGPPAVAALKVSSTGLALLTVAELQARLRAAGLKVSGRKSELLERCLLERLAGHAPPALEGLASSDVLDRRTTLVDEDGPPRAGDLDGSADSTASGAAPRVSMFRAFAVPDLKMALRSHGLDVSGPREDLVERLEVFDAELQGHVLTLDASQRKAVLSLSAPQLRALLRIADRIADRAEHR